MRIWRLEFGPWKSDDPKQLRWIIDLDKAQCGCYILDFGPFYITWLGNECYTIIRSKNE